MAFRWSLPAFLVLRAAPAFPPSSRTPRIDFRPVYVPDKGDLDNLLSARLPAFARLDARVSFRPKGPGGRWLFYLDAINVLDRENVGAYEPSLEYNPGGDRPRLLLSRPPACRSCRRSASASGSEARPIGAQRAQRVRPNRPLS